MKGRQGDAVLWLPPVLMSTHACKFTYMTAHTHTEDERAKREGKEKKYKSVMLNNCDCSYSVSAGNINIINVTHYSKSLIESIPNFLICTLKHKCLWWSCGFKPGAYVDRQSEASHSSTCLILLSEGKSSEPTWAT